MMGVGCGSVFGSSGECLLKRCEMVSKGMGWAGIKQGRLYFVVVSVKGERVGNSFF